MTAQEPDKVEGFGHTEDGGKSTVKGADPEACDGNKTGPETDHREAAAVREQFRRSAM